MRYSKLIPRRMLASAPPGALHNRGTGTSTVLALRTLAGAITYPGRPIPIRDHHYCSHGKADRHLMHMMQEMVAKLGLKHIMFDKVRMTVTSNHMTDNIEELE